MVTTVRLGFSVSFLHDSLHHYRHMKPDEEVALRAQYLAALVGGKQAAFDALLKSSSFAPVVDDTAGFLGGQQAWELARTAVVAFNGVDTGTQFDDPPPEPHCVQYYWIDGEVYVVYNYLLTASTCGATCPPPGGTYHIVVSTKVA